MADATSPKVESNDAKDTTTAARLIFSWSWVGIPLAWGVWQTVIKSLPLFQSFMPHGM